MKEKDYLTFCGGKNLKKIKTEIFLLPEVAFRLEILAKENKKELCEYIEILLKEHTEKAFSKREDFYKKYFE